MRSTAMVLMLACLVAPVLAQEKADEGPTNEKAQKTYKEGLEYLHQRRTEAALGSFKKADKQDDGHCPACQQKMLKALAVGMKFPSAINADGLVLAQLKQDDAAKARFEEFVKLQPENDPDRQRALRYISQPDLARARMAPPFAITTADGQRVSMDDLAGKVVLLDFWATWCGPCREALPHIREIAKKFQGQPLVVLSISLDTDEQKWKEFVAKNEMTWLQYRDNRFTGPIAKGFGVQAIPHTFTIDSDGVL